MGGWRAARRGAAAAKQFSCRVGVQPRKGAKLRALGPLWTIAGLAVCLWFAPRAVFSVPPQTYVTSVRDHAGLAEAYCQGRAQCTPLVDRVREFENGNTFVQIQTQLTYQDLIVLLPDVLSSDQLMEALIKVHTAKTQGARHISVRSKSGLAAIRVMASKSAESPPGPHPSIDPATINLDLAALFAVAGATSQGDLNADRALTPRWVPVMHWRAPVEVMTLGMNASSSGSAELSHQVADRLGVRHLSAIDFLPQPLQSAKQFVRRIILFGPTTGPTNDQFLQTLAQIRKIRAAGDEVILVTPYLPYSRTDKIDQIGVTVTGRLIADLIESAGAQAIAFVRPHAPQSEGFFSIPTLNVSGRMTITRYLRTKQVDLIAPPDAGAQKEGLIFADALGKELVCVNKQRDPETGEIRIRGISGPSVKGKRVAIIDDETSSGKTLGEVAAYLKDLGASEVFAVVTHLAGSASKVIGSPYVDALVVTDTLPITLGSAHQLIVLPIADELAEKIRPFVSDCEGWLTADTPSSPRNDGQIETSK